MAMQINAGEVKRQDLLLIDVENIKVDFSKRGRQQIPTQQDIERLAKSILENPGGQLQPCRVRRLADKTVELFFGFTRYQAVKWINDNQGLQGDQRLKLKVIVTECNDLDAFLQNIDENNIRNTTTAVDDAYNQRRLRDTFGFTETQIAERYNCTVAWVAQLKRLLLLAPDIQARIGQGMSTSAALQLCDLSEDEQRKVLAVADEAGTTLKATEVKKAKRASTTAGGDHSRSMREVKGFFEALNGPSEDEPVRLFAKSVISYLAGKTSDKAFENAIHRLRENR